MHDNLLDCRALIASEVSCCGSGERAQLGRRASVTSELHRYRLLQLPFWLASPEALLHLCKASAIC